MREQARTRAIGIIGMHRSGTSAIARAVNLLGPYIGRSEDLMGPVEGDNPRGFWEHLAIFSLHERLLEELGHPWDRMLPLPDGWWGAAEVQPYRKELTDIITREFGGHGAWMWKDPRTSLLLPLWRGVLDALGIDGFFIICARHPLDVARSLERRNRYPITKGLMLWMYHNLCALLRTQGAKRMVVSYDSLLDDPMAVLKNISSAADLPWPRDDAPLRAALSEFLSADLRHSRTERGGFATDETAHQHAASLHGLLLKAEKDIHYLDSTDCAEAVATLNEGYLNALNMTSIRDRWLLMTPEEMATLKAEMSKEAEVAAQAAQITGLNAQAAQIAAQAAQITALNAQVAAQAAQMTALDAAVNTLNREITVQAEAFAGLHEEHRLAVARLHEELKGSHDVIVSQQAELERLRHIERSRTWRLCRRFLALLEKAGSLNPRPRRPL